MANRNVPGGRCSSALTFSVSSSGVKPISLTFVLILCRRGDHVPFRHRRSGTLLSISGSDVRVDDTLHWGLE